MKRDFLKPIPDDNISRITVEYETEKFLRVSVKAEGSGSVSMQFLTIYGDHLHVSFQGDRGNWGYDWYGTGRKGFAGALEFFTEVDPEYVMKKMYLGQERHYDQEATEANVRTLIFEARRNKHIDEQTARRAYDAVRDLYNETELQLFLDDALDILDVYESPAVYSEPFDLQVACYRYMPAFQRYIKAEILPEVKRRESMVRQFHDILNNPTLLDGNGRRAMKVLVTGGRHYGYDLEERDLLTFTLGYVLQPGDELIHGDCTGADFWAKEYAVKNGITQTPYAVNHVLDGDWPGAGPRRNQRMLQCSDPHLIIAFPGGKGTAGMIRIAKLAGYSVLEIESP